MAAFCARRAGRARSSAATALGAEILLRAVATGRLRARAARADAQPPAPPAARPAAPRRWRALARAPARCPASTARSPTPRARLPPRARHDAAPPAANPAARDLVRHAFADVGGNANLARSWARFARALAAAARSATLLDRYAAPRHAGAAAVGRRGPRPPAGAAPRRRSTCCPTRSCACCRGTGYLIAYDDPVGVARELARSRLTVAPTHLEGVRGSTRSTNMTTTSSSGAARPPRPSTTSRSPASRPGLGHPLARAHQGRRGAASTPTSACSTATSRERIAAAGDRGRRRRARRPVPDRRLPDRLGHVVEHERQRGHRDARRRGAHPNDHVNMGQSSNDVFPRAVHLAALDEATNHAAAGARAARARRSRRKADAVQRTSSSPAART